MQPLPDNPENPNEAHLPKTRCKVPMPFSHLSDHAISAKYSPQLFPNLNIEPSQKSQASEQINSITKKHRPSMPASKTAKQINSIAKQHRPSMPDFGKSYKHQPNSKKSQGTKFVSMNPSPSHQSQVKRSLTPGFIRFQS